MIYCNIRLFVNSCNNMKKENKNIFYKYTFLLLFNQITKDADSFKSHYKLNKTSLNCKSKPKNSIKFSQIFSISLVEQIYIQYPRVTFVSNTMKNICSLCLIKFYTFRREESHCSIVLFSAHFHLI